MGRWNAIAGVLLLFAGCGDRSPASSPLDRDAGVEETRQDAAGAVTDAGGVPADPCSERRARLYGSDGVFATMTPRACDTAPGGEPWPPQGPLESEPGFEAALAALEIDALPEVIDTTELFDLALAYAAYALDEPLCGEADPGDCVSAIYPSLQKADALARGPLGQVVLGAIAKGSEGDAALGIDFGFLRRGLHRYYACSRPFPADLQGFRDAVFDYPSFPSYEVDSFPKHGIRRIYEDHCLGVYVGESFDEEGNIADTEILLSDLRSDGNLDFLAFNPDGQLVDRGYFATLPGNTVLAAAPYVCTACHLQRDARPYRFDVRFPDMGDR